MSLGILWDWAWEFSSEQVLLVVWPCRSWLLSELSIDLRGYDRVWLSNFVFSIVFIIQVDYEFPFAGLQWRRLFFLHYSCGGRMYSSASWSNSPDPTKLLSFFQMQLASLCFTFYIFENHSPSLRLTFRAAAISRTVKFVMVLFTLVVIDTDFSSFALS